MLFALGNLKIINYLTQNGADGKGAWCFNTKKVKLVNSEWNNINYFSFFILFARCLSVFLRLSECSICMIYIMIYEQKPNITTIILKQLVQNQ